MCIRDRGGVSGAGIGGGNLGEGSDITITGSAEVTAQGSNSGSGIGGGSWGRGSNITVSEDAQVKAQGGNAVGTHGAGSSIGDGGFNNQNGREVTPNTDDLNEGWIATYAPGTTDLDTAIPDTLTYQGVVEAGNAVPVAKLEPTCTDPGHEAGFMIGDVLVAVTIPATGHNVPDGTPNGDATCVKLGTMTGYCTNCKTEVTVPDPNYAPHTFTTYTPDPDNLATCTQAGTKTAVCDVCKNATDTLPDPAKGHNVPNGTPNGDATCVKLGTMTGYCTNCKTEVTVPDPNYAPHTFTTYTPDPDNLATCTQAGTKTAVCDVCKNATDTLPDPAKGHSFTNYVYNNNAQCGKNGTETAICDRDGCQATHTRTKENSALTHKFTNYIPDGNATCTKDGTKTAKCGNGCGKTHTVTDVGSALGHSFSDYISNKDATYTEDGTKTAKCDHPDCDETDTIPDLGTRLPCYQVKGKDGKAIPHQNVRKDGVLTITVDADFAILTGTLGGINALKAQGIDTIVFVTKAASSTFALSDLLEQGSIGDSYKLTHDCETVSFTLGKKETDVTGILAKP